MAGITPLVRKFKQGTFVTFQSTGEDITSTFNNSVNKFKFSKFALLEIPPIQNQTNGKNNIQFNNIEGAFVDGLSTASPPPEGDRVDLSQSLQNYLLNMETLLIRNDDYDATLKKTPAERLFFKWMKEIGALRFREANNQENVGSEDRFTEENPNSSPSSGDLYSRVVKYIGELDMEGNHKSNSNAFKEVYIYVPTQNGSTPTIMFKSEEDDNYFAGQTIRKPASDPDIEFIAGRDASDDPTSAGLSVSALYDMDVPLGSLDYTVNGGSDDIWFNALAPNGPNAYFTDPTFGDPTTDVILREDPSGPEEVTYRRSRLDGIGIDWDTQNYKFFSDNPTVKKFNEYNSDDAASSFRFNAIAIYYDVFDPNNLDQDGNPVDIETNLYGILFLNDLESISGGASQIEYLDKIKPNPITGQQGNGYGIKLNLKFDVTADSVQETEVEITVDPYNTFSMELFSDTMQRIALMNKNYEKVIQDNIELANSIDNLENLIINDANKQELLSEINQINSKIEDIESDSDLLSLISRNTERIEEILEGNTTVDLSFALDLKALNGLRMELVGNELSITNERQKYGLVESVNINTSPNQLTGVYNVLKLGDYSTLYYHSNNGSQKIAQDNIVIFVDDSDNRWKTNQSMEILLQDEIDFQNYGIIIVTDANNRFNLTSSYSKVCGTISDVKSMKPRIEVICIDGSNYDFIVTQK